MTVHFRRKQTAGPAEIAKLPLIQNPGRRSHKFNRMSIHIFNQKQAERSNSGAMDFIVFSDNEMAAVLGGGEETRPVMVLPSESDHLKGISDQH